MFKFKIKALDCYLSYARQAANLYGGPPPPQVILTTLDGRSWTVDWELLETLIEPADGDAQMFWEGLKMQLSPPKRVEEELVGMRMTPREDGSFEVKQITKPKDES